MNFLFNKFFLLKTTLFIFVIISLYCGPRMSPRQMQWSNTYRGNIATQPNNLNQPYNQNNQNQPYYFNSGNVQNVMQLGNSVSDVAMNNIINRINQFGLIKQQNFIRVFLTDSQQIYRPFYLQQGLCYLAAITSNSNQPSSVGLVSSQLVPLTQGILGDEGSFIRFCPTISDTYFISLSSNIQSDFLIGIFSGNPDRVQAAITNLIPTNNNAQPSTNQAMTNLRNVENELISQGYISLIGPVERILGQNSRFSTPLMFNSGNCYKILAYGGEGVNNIDLEIISPRGIRIAGEAETNQNSNLSYCANESGIHQILFNMERGTGPIVYEILSTSQSGSTAISNVTNPQENFNLLNRDILLKGYEVYGSSNQLNVPANGDKTINLSLEKGSCYGIGVISSVNKLGVSIFNSNGEEIDRNNTEGQLGIVRTCIQKQGANSIVIENKNQNASKIIYQAYKFTQGTKGAFGLSGLIYVRLMETISALGREGYEPSEPPVKERNFKISEGETKNHPIKLEAGRCYAISAVGGEKLYNLDITLVNNSGSEISKSIGEEQTPIVRFCAVKTDNYKLNIISKSGAGNYLYQLLVKTSNN